MQKENKMGTMDTNKLILSMSLPMIASMMVQALYNVVDSIFVSMISEDALTAVSLCFPIQNLMIACAVGTNIGVNALLARSLGERKKEKADKIANIGMFLSIVLGFLFMLMGFFITKSFFDTQDVSDDIKIYGMQYMKVVCIYSFSLCFQICFERLFSATGLAKYTMITQMSGAITNIILDPIFIFVFKMGVEGAAIATIIGQSIGSIIGLYYTITKNNDIHLSLKSIITPNFEIIKEIYKISFPSIIMQSIGSFTLAGFNYILIAFSSTAIAFYGIYFKIQSFIILPIIGIANGLVPVVAYNYGARNKQRIVDSIKVSFKYAFIITSVGIIILQIFPIQILRVFNASNAMIAIGVPALRIISFAYLSAFACIILSSTFQALGSSYFSMIVSFIRQIIVLLPLAYFFAKTGNISLVWSSYLFAEIVALIMSILYAKALYKKIEF